MRNQYEYMRNQEKSTTNHCTLYVFNVTPYTNNNLKCFYNVCVQCYTLH